MVLIFLLFLLASEWNLWYVPGPSSKWAFLPQDADDSYIYVFSWDLSQSFQMHSTFSTWMSHGYLKIKHQNSNIHPHPVFSSTISCLSIWSCLPPSSFKSEVTKVNPGTKGSLPHLQEQVLWICTWEPLVPTASTPVQVTITSHLDYSNTILSNISSDNFLPLKSTFDTILVSLKY